MLKIAHSHECHKKVSCGLLFKAFDTWAKSWGKVPVLRPCKRCQCQYQVKELQSVYSKESIAKGISQHAFEFFRICLKKAQIITYLTDNGVAVERHDFDHGLHDRDDKVFWVAQPKLGKVSRHTNQKPEHVELYQVQLLLAT